MFKNMILYRYAVKGAMLEFSHLERALELMPFVAGGATSELSYGWVPPRGEEHGALVESVGGQWIARFLCERKSVPVATLNALVEAKCQKIEEEFGRKPGKRERQELKDEAKLDLLPKAFPTLSATWVWIDPVNKLLVIDGTVSKADQIVTSLVSAVKGLGFGLVHSKASPGAAMSRWLLNSEAPVGFSVDRECELKAADESKAVVRYTRHTLDIEAVRNHVKRGLLPTRLSMTYDDRVSFVLKDSLNLSKIEILEEVMLSKQAEDGDSFATNFAIATGELQKMIPALLEALDGESPHSGLQGIDCPASIEATATFKHAEATA